MKKIKIFIAAGIALGLCGGGSVVYFALGDREYVWGVPAGFFVVCVLLSGYGLWRMQKWALKLSWALAVWAFGFGCYIAHFRWTFWLFITPTFQDRLLAVLDPRASLFVVVPLFWMIYFTRPSTRRLFNNN